MPQRARVKGDWLVPLPEGLSAAQAMAIGTAGYTAMLCLMALDHHGVTPAQGPVLVTGASGGVGSVAVALLARAGWHVIASTGRDCGGRLPARPRRRRDPRPRRNSASPASRSPRSAGRRPIDAVGSITLANVLAGPKADGAVAACGLAQGMDLPTSVAPFILRGSRCSASTA